MISVTSATVWSRWQTSTFHTSKLALRNAAKPERVLMTRKAGATGLPGLRRYKTEACFATGPTVLAALRESVAGYRRVHFQSWSRGKTVPGIKRTCVRPAYASTTNAVSIGNNNSNTNNNIGTSNITDNKPATSWQINNNIVDYEPHACAVQKQCFISCPWTYAGYQGLWRAELLHRNVVVDVVVVVVLSSVRTRDKGRYCKSSILFNVLRPTRIYQSFALLLCFSLWAEHVGTLRDFRAAYYLWRFDWMKLLGWWAARHFKHARYIAHLQQPDTTRGQKLPLLYNIQNGKRRELELENFSTRECLLVT